MARSITVAMCIVIGSSVGRWSHVGVCAVVRQFRVFCSWANKMLLVVPEKDDVDKAVVQPCV